MRCCAPERTCKRQPASGFEFVAPLVLLELRRCCAMVAGAAVLPKSLHRCTAGVAGPPALLTCTIVGGSWCWRGRS
jgi:hypothetical protein